MPEWWDHLNRQRPSDRLKSTRLLNRFGFSRPLLGSVIGAALAAAIGHWAFPEVGALQAFIYGAIGGAVAVHFTDLLEDELVEAEERRQEEE